MDGLDLGTDPLPLPPHSALGASAMDRWSHCPGSFALSLRERHRLPTIHAATGTIAHDLVEKALATRDPVGALMSFEGREFVVDGHVVAVDEAMILGVGIMLDYLKQRSRDLGVKPLVEQTVFVDGYFPPEAPPPVRMFGRSDAWLQTPELVEIVDYKNGSGVLVNVVDHPQLLFYAAGVLAALGVVGFIAPRYVKLTVVQPNARTQEKIHSYDLTTMDVLMWVHDTMIPAVRACEAPDAPYVPGSWCRFCPVAHACPKLHQDALDAARMQFDDSAEGQELADRLTLAEHVTLWADALKGYALERVQAGVHIPGWGATPTRPRRVWTDPAAVIRALTEAGVDPYKREIKSPAQLEKHLKREPTLWEMIVPWIESRSSGVKIARTHADDDDGVVFDTVD